MKAYIKEGVVIGLYADADYHAPPVTKESGVTAVPLEGRADIPSLGWTYDGKKFSTPEEVSPAVVTTLTMVRESALITVDKEASAIRAKAIGPNEHQMAIYSAKSLDGRSWQLKILGTNVEDYKWIQAEVSATGESPDAVAEKFVKLYSALTTALSSVEEHRIYGKNLIRAADEAACIRKAKTMTLTEFRKIVANL